jgi:hypothetical protein
MYSQQANGQRNAITQALMNIANPPPRPVMPQQHMQMPQQPVPGAPPQGQPLPQAPPTSMPLSPGMPPQQPQPGMPPPGTAAMPQGMPMGSAMGQSPMQQQPMPQQQMPQGY